MDREKFKEYAKNYNVIPVYEMITADLLTPVLAYLKIRKKDNFSFLLESVEGIGRLARYSFIGFSPSVIVQSQKNKVIVKSENSTKVYENGILNYLNDQVNSFKHPKIADLPDFNGGIVGYLGFETISEIENSIVFNNNKTDKFPDSILGLFDSIIAFDHFKHRIIVITNVILNNDSNLDVVYDKAKNKISELKNLIGEVTDIPATFSLTGKVVDEIDELSFSKNIEKIKRNIFDGEVFQLVYSERFSSEYKGDLINLYRALRIINPSPYMYIFEFDNDLSIIGTSPEDLLKVRNNKATILPIAGTRRRGKTEQEDNALEEELLKDEKEIAEHTMLVDLARNDLGRVCKHDTVNVTELMKMQIVLMRFELASLLVLYQVHPKFVQFNL
jgi:anthranilate synthase component 1